MAFDVSAYIARVQKCDPSNERESVLVNLRANGYTRAADIEADIADIEQRDAARREAEKGS